MPWILPVEAKLSNRGWPSGVSQAGKRAAVGRAARALIRPPYLWWSLAGLGLLVLLSQLPNTGTVGDLAAALMALYYYSIFTHAWKRELCRASESDHLSAPRS
jgi:hypothetical protein